jgi:DNA-binding response OmpR family regulator
MQDRRVLIVEDDEKSGKLLKDFLSLNDFLVTLRINGKEALAEFHKNPFSVVITDMEMPVMDGNELITQLVKSSLPPLIFVLTVHQDPGLIIKVMKKGIFDYLTKPVNLDDLLFKVRRAFDVFEMQKTKWILDKEKSIRLENHIEWYKWLHSIKQKETKNIQSAVFGNLQRSFNQGMGFGSLITAVNLIALSARHEGDKYLIDAELFQLMKENAEVSEKTIKNFQKIDQILNEGFELEEITIATLIELATEVLHSLKKYRHIKNQQIMVSDYKNIDQRLKLKLNREYFREALYEIMINAMKFSEADSRILVIYRIFGNFLSLSVVNNPQQDLPEETGIPLGYENLIFEPFFRLSSQVYDEFQSQDFGLGLTLVEKIVLSHQGNISIHNIKDFSDVASEPVIKVNATISLPLIQDKES